MTTAVNILAVIGAFCVLCALTVAAACTADALTDRWNRRRHVCYAGDIEPEPCGEFAEVDLTPYIQQANDAAFLFARGIDPSRVAVRPYDHEREGL